jgi:hypothetical protein
MLFLGFYWLLLYHNRYAADDYFFVYDAKVRGVIGAAVFTAQTWTPRPAEMLMYNTLTKYLPEQVVLIGYGLVALLLLVIAICKLFKAGANYLGLQLSNLNLINYALLFCCSFFFVTISIGETWFWLCSSMGYLLSLVAFLWGLVFLINKKHTLAIYILLLMCFAYVMGAAETFAVFVLVVLWGYLVIVFYKNRGGLIKLFSDVSFKKLFVVSLVCLVILLIIYLGVGTQFRRSLLKQASVFDTFLISTKAMAFLLIKRMPDKLPYLLLFSIPFLWLGKQLIGNALAALVFSKRSLLIICISFLILTFISLIPAAYIMSDRGPDRSLTINAFLFAALFAYLFIYIGYKTYGLDIKFIIPGALLVNTSLIIFMAVQQYGVINNYSKAVDKRIEFVELENKNGRTELLELEPLPQSGLFYSAELSSDTAYYKNTFFKQRFGLKFSCVVKE